MKNTNWPALPVSASHCNGLNSLNFVGFIPKERGTLACLCRILMKSTGKSRQGLARTHTKGNYLNIQAYLGWKAPIRGQHCQTTDRIASTSLLNNAYEGTMDFQNHSKRKKAIRILILQPQKAFFTQNLSESLLCSTNGRLPCWSWGPSDMRYFPPLKSQLWVKPLMIKMWKLRPREGEHHAQGQRVS